ncbi:Leucine aminopeptidase 1 [Blyttiomyces sp. JEL0837]|nr:Leucine aminopeptidase 1 [Blyttiomyces sp. JEL0837]
MRFTSLTTLVLTATSAISSVSAFRPNTPLKSDFAPINAATAGPPAPITIPSAPAFQSVVKPLIGNIDATKLHDWIVTLTQFPDRYYKGTNGIKAAKWILDGANALTPPAGAKLTASYFNHTGWSVPSVIVRYEPTTPTTLKGIVITGSHMDTIANGAPAAEPYPQPAADDCASGSGVVFEALRVLVTSGFVPARPIEFHWYTAEEEGIYGSNDVAEAYAKKGISVVSYLNLDQSGYVKAGTKPVMAIVTDYTTSGSTNLLKGVVNAYTSMATATTACGYACTDNSAWYNHKYEAAMTVESLFSDSSPNSDKVNSDGSPVDTIATLNFTHIQQFVKSTIGYVVELSLTGSTVSTTTTSGSTSPATSATSSIPSSTTSATSSIPSSTTSTTTSATSTAPACAHPICKTGTKLTAACDPCAQKIIAQDSYCGNTQWDSQCVSEVKSICGITC